MFQGSSPTKKMSVQNYDWTADHRIFTGQSGTGKTTLALEMLLKEKAKWKFVFDAKGGEIGHRFKLPTCYTLDDLIRATDAGGWVVFNPSREFPGAKKEAFAFFCDFVWEVAQTFKGRKILFGDELQSCVHKHKPTAEFQIILDEGRSFQLDTRFISSAPNRIYCDHRQQFNRVFAFRQVDGNATEFLKEAGIDENQVRALPNGKYLWRFTDSGEAGDGGEAF